MDPWREAAGLAAVTVGFYSMYVGGGHNFNCLVCGYALRYRPHHRFRHTNTAVGSCMDMCSVPKLVSFGLSGQARYPAFGLRNSFAVS